MEGNREGDPTQWRRPPSSEVDKVRPFRVSVLLLLSTPFMLFFFMYETVIEVHFHIVPHLHIWTPTAERMRLDIGIRGESVDCKSPKATATHAPYRNRHEGFEIQIKTLYSS